MGSLRQIPNNFDRLVWESDLRGRPAWQRWLITGARMAYSVADDLIQGQLTLQAMSLVYTTLLSLVPLLAVSFSVLKGFGIHNQIEPLLRQALEPLGAQAGTVVTRLIEYVDKTNVGVLGSVGVGLLLWSVISLISKIEQVFNYTWRVDRPRSLGQRFSQYLSVLLVGPVLFFAALGATASLSSNAIVRELLEIAPLGFLIESVGRLVPYLLIMLAFTFAYSFLPNTRVQIKSALIGAVVAGLLWQSVGYMFATFMASSTRYAAIYSGLAILILFMIWIYIAWLILLVGASIAFYHQYPEYLGRRTHDLRLSNRLRERLGLMVAARIVRSYLEGGAEITSDGLAHELGVPLTNVRNMLRMLESGNLVVRTADDPPRFVPARSPDGVRLQELMLLIRRYGEDDKDPRMAVSPATPGVGVVEQRLLEAADAALAEWTLQDLALMDHAGTPIARREPDQTDGEQSAAGGSEGVAAQASGSVPRSSRTGP